MDFQRPAYVAAKMAVNVTQEDLTTNQFYFDTSAYDPALHIPLVRKEPIATPKTRDKIYCVLERVARNGRVVSAQVMGMHYDGDCLGRKVKYNNQKWKKLNPSEYASP